MGIVAIVIIAVLVLLALVAGFVIIFLRRPLPRTRGTVVLPGLKGEVEVLRDRWGVPHIYASSDEDLFFAQGYVHAQDRLWQLEFQRRAAAGRLSELTGEVTLEVDRFFRTIGLGRAAEAEIEVLDGETLHILESYAAGINACIAARPDRLSIEFTLLGIEPEPWRAADILYIEKLLTWTLSCNWMSELIRARLAAKMGADLATDLEPTYPADNPSIVQGKGIPPGAEPPPNGWRSEALRDALRLVEGLFQADPPLSPPAPGPGVGLATGGSNQWTVAGSRSATGWPLLANDTHLQLSMPAAWYQNHLVGGEYNVTGVSFPGIPGVLVGHNEHCAWGATTAWQDIQDLYVEKLNPDNPHQYEYQGEWHDAEVVHEEIRVNDREAPVVQEVVITRHGPIISDVVGEQTPVALRWVGAEPCDLLCSALSIIRARNWEEFRAAFADWSAPPHNFVYADNLGEKGNIGYLQAGWVPVRAKGYGLAPVPGWTGEYEWLGYLPLDELPQAYNPESGWLATANHLVVDGEYPHFLSSDLENPARARRVVDLIKSKSRLTLDDCVRFQLDTYSEQGKRFVQHLLEIEPQTLRGERAKIYLEHWDGRMEPDSVAASVYQVTRLRALHILFAGHLGDVADDYVGLDTMTPIPEYSPYHGRSIVRLLQLLDGEGGGDDIWLRDPVSGQVRSRQDLLRQALGEALQLLQAQLGPAVDRWQWRRLNQVHFAHPAGEQKPLNLLFNRGPYAQSGDHDTLLRAQSQPRFPPAPVAVGDAVRFVADVSDWERCRIVIPGGQSGHVASKHYADLLPLWREGRSQPMPFARDQVEQHTAQRLVLVPE